LGFEPDDEDHVPHVTLARIERAKTRGPLTAHIIENAQMTFGVLDTSAVVLYESLILPSGPRYTELAKAAL
jgi:2'-5' RNA ligase